MKVEVIAKTGVTSTDCTLITGKTIEVTRGRVVHVERKREQAVRGMMIITTSN